MTLKVKNNVSSTVADNPLTAAALVLNVAPGGGSDFPSTGIFRLTIWNESISSDPVYDPKMEIVECTMRSDDMLTITRGCEGTSPSEHDHGNVVAMLLTAGIFDDDTHGVYNMNIDGGTF